MTQTNSEHLPQHHWAALRQPLPQGCDQFPQLLPSDFIALHMLEDRIHQPDMYDAPAKRRPTPS
jgi:hypothetical protein